MKSLFRHWPVNLAAALGLAVIGLVCFLRNEYNVYSAAKMGYALVLAVPAFVCVSLIANILIFPAWDSLDRMKRRSVILIALAGLAAAIWLFPPPEPDFPTKHHLVISATGENKSPSTGTLVELRDLRYLNGRRVPPKAVHASPDWEVSGTTFRSRGGSESRLEIDGSMPVGVAVHLRYLSEGGIVSITWDGVTERVDLFKHGSMIMPMPFRNKGLLSMPLGPALLTATAWVAYGAGIIALLLGSLALLYRLVGRRAGVVVYWVAILVLAGLFICLKLAYLQADGPHSMLDSTWYVMTSEQPLNSAQFWSGLRPFTIPLAIKLLGIHLQDYLSGDQLARWAHFQTLFSAFAWLVLGLSLAGAVRRRWLSVVLFGIVLGISLSVEVSLWDELLLSESLSFSLFVLMLAGWVSLLIYLPMLRRTWMRWALIVFTTLITILYAYGRDSNIYFALGGVVVMALGCLLDRRLMRIKHLIWAYTGITLIVLVTQTISVSAGNRWQVFMYDHLAMRILVEPQATNFFAREGLPLSDQLMAVTQMSGKQYMPLMRDTAEFKPVRDWIDCCGKTVYLKYLFSNPLRTLTEPFANWQLLVNGNLRGYRNPRDGISSPPERLDELSIFFFSHAAWVVALLALASLFGIISYLYSRDFTGWILIAALAIPLLPMMYLVWYAEPMEVERHSAQIILQLRLAGWLALALLADKAVEGIKKGLLAAQPLINLQGES